MTKKFFKFIGCVLLINLFLATSVQAELSPFGLNEGIGQVPVVFLKDASPDFVYQTTKRQAAFATRVGLKSYRVHCAAKPASFAQNNIQKTEEGFDFSLQDAFVKAIQETDLELLVSLAPYWQCNRPLFSMIPDGSTYYPKDEAAFEQYVMAVVERYDGDGVDDMPGLKRPIKYWQLDNEVDGKRDARIGKSQRPQDWINPQSYLKLLKLTRKALKTADPEAKLAPSFLVIARPQAPGYQNFFKEFIAGGGEDYVDAIDFHEYNYDLVQFKKSIQTVKSLLKKDTPLWILETSVPSQSDAKAGFDHKVHAQDIVKWYVTAFAEGVEKVFWHTLKDGPKRDHRAWKSFGTNGFYDCVEGQKKTSAFDLFDLIDSAWAQQRPPRRPGFGRGPGQRQQGQRRKGPRQARPQASQKQSGSCQSWVLKPGAHTYKLMVEKLQGFTKAQEIKNNVYRFDFENKKSIVVAWSDASKNLDLSEWWPNQELKVTNIITEDGQTEALVKSQASNKIQTNVAPIFIEAQ